MKRILVIEPYYGGSHKQFLLGLKDNVDAEFIFLTLPARKWKLRMQLAAPWFADKIEELNDRNFSTLLCSTFVDVAVLRALLTIKPWWNKNCIICTYFHENQFVYPSQVEDLSYKQFSAINFTTALASDRIAFNSHYNLRSFIEKAGRFAVNGSDMKMPYIMDDILSKASVIYPGIDFDHFSGVRSSSTEIPVICWNHRWEHDKNPQEFFDTLFQLQDQGYDFRLIILGQSFMKKNKVFTEAKKKLSAKIIHFGYVKSRKKYIELLHLSDIVVSTSHHEFFGISVLEAVAAGSIPLVPNRLSYQELYPAEYRYNEGQFVDRLVEVLENVKYNTPCFPIMDTDKFSWKALRHKYTAWLLETY